MRIQSERKQLVRLRLLQTLQVGRRRSKIVVVAMILDAFRVCVMGRTSCAYVIIEVVIRCQIIPSFGAIINHIRQQHSSRIYQFLMVNYVLRIAMNNAIDHADCQSVNFYAAQHRKKQLWTAGFGSEYNAWSCDIGCESISRALTQGK